MKQLTAVVLFGTLFLSACAGHNSTPTAVTGSRPHLRVVNANSNPHFVAEYPISSPTFALVRGEDGNVWFSEPFASIVGRITPSGTVTEFSIPIGGTPRGLATGPNGNTWFALASHGAGYLGEILPSGSVALHAIPTNSPRFLTTGPDGNIWYDDDDANVVVKYRPDGTTTQYAIPTPNSGPRGIAVGLGGRMWFDEFQSSKLASITTDGTITEYDAPTNPFATPAMIDGRMWYMAQNQFARVTLGGHVDTVALPDLPGGIAGGANGRIWVALQDLNELVSMNSDGSQIQAYAIPTAGATPVGMVLGSDNNIWFSEPLASVPQIGVFHP